MLNVIALKSHTIFLLKGFMQQTHAKVTFCLKNRIVENGPYFCLQTNNKQLSKDAKRKFLGVLGTTVGKLYCVLVWYLSNCLFNFLFYIIRLQINYYNKL